VLVKVFSKQINISMLENKLPRGFNHRRMKLINRVFKTDVTPLRKVPQIGLEQSATIEMYADDQFVYKVFLGSRQHEQFELFLKNYQGSMQILDVYRQGTSTNFLKLSIFKINKIPGMTLTNIGEEKLSFEMSLPKAVTWFRDQIIEIHNTGIRCNERYEQFKVGNDPWDHGFVFTFSDWHGQNILFDSKTKKLHLVDFEPIDWIPVNTWQLLIKDQLRSFLNGFPDEWKRHHKLYRHDIVRKITQELQDDLNQLIKYVF